jgi:hypothetical protein
LQFQSQLSANNAVWSVRWICSVSQICLIFLLSAHVPWQVGRPVVQTE